MFSLHLWEGYQKHCYSIISLFLCFYRINDIVKEKQSLEDDNKKLDSLLKEETCERNSFAKENQNLREELSKF